MAEPVAVGAALQHPVVQAVCTVPGVWPIWATLLLRVPNLFGFVEARQAADWFFERQAAHARRKAETLFTVTLDLEGREDREHGGERDTGVLGDRGRRLAAGRGRVTVVQRGP